MRSTLVFAVVVAAALVAVLPTEAGELSALFDLNVRIGDGGFTLDGRVGGPLGPTSGALTGRLRRDGVTLDGWFDDRGKTWLFELDANLRDGMRAVVRPSPQRI